MDKLSQLSRGAQIVLAASIAFLIVSFFNWQEVDFGPIGDVGVSMWNGVGWIAGLAAIALIVWQVLRLANVKLEIGVMPAVLTAALAALLVLFTLIKILDDGEFRTFWAWLGLVLSVVVAVGAWLNLQESGERIPFLQQSAVATPAAAPPAAPSAPAAMPPAASASEPAAPEAASDAGEDEAPSTA